jgi:hypothetical protein
MGYSRNPFCFRPAEAPAAIFKRVFDAIVRQKSLKFVAISAAPRRNCGQTLQRLNPVSLDGTGARPAGMRGKSMPARFARSLPERRGAVTSTPDFPEMSAAANR